MQETDFKAGLVLIQLNIQLNKDNNKRICICNADELNLVYVRDIVRCESKRNYTTVYLQDKSKLVASKTLGDFEELLGGYNFFRVHHSNLINLDFVKGFRKKDGGSVMLMDGSEVSVATRKKDEFIKLLKSM